MILGEQPLVGADNLPLDNALAKTDPHNKQIASQNLVSPNIFPQQHSSLGLHDKATLVEVTLGRIPVKLASDSGVFEVKSWRGKETVLSSAWD